MYTAPLEIVEKVQKDLPRHRLVICREDLPINPLWSRLGYPNPHCWNPSELMYTGADSRNKYPEIFHEAKRLYWECIHRSWGTYVRGRPFFNVYECNVELKTCRDIPETPKIQYRVIGEIISTAMTVGIGVPGREIYTRIFGKPMKKLAKRLKLTK